MKGRSALRWSARSAHARTLASVFALLAMLASLISADMVLAQPDTAAPPAEEAELPVEPTEIPPADSPGVDVADIPDDPVAEIPDAEPTTEPTTEPVGDDGFHLTISVYRCDHPAFDPYFSSNSQMVIDTCTGPGSGQFTVEGPFPTQSGSGSELSFTVSDSLFIVESLAPGYDASIANCFLRDANGVVVDQIGPGKTGGGAWKVGSFAGDVHCDWYQVDRGIGVVYIVNMACPNALGFPVPTMQELVSICTAPAGAMQFMVTFAGDRSRVNTTGGEFNDVFFDAIPAGKVTMSPTEPNAYGSPKVFCQVNTLDGVELAPFQPATVHDGQAADFTLGHGQRLHCAWFNIPESPGLVLDPGSSDAPMATVPPQGSQSTLVVRTYECPPGYDPTEADADPATDCGSGPDGVAFMLADADPGTVDLQSATGDAEPSTVTFGGLAAGDYTLSGDTPAGVDAAFVLGCGGGGGIDPIPQFIEGTVAVGLPQGVILTCRWFTIQGLGAVSNAVVDGTPVASAVTSEEVSMATPATGQESGGALRVETFACTTQAFVSDADCEPGDDGRDFDLVWWNGEAWEVSASGSTGDTGEVSWQELEPGAYWLDDRGQAWCQLGSDQLSDDGNWLGVAAGGETVVRVYDCSGR